MRSRTKTVTFIGLTAAAALLLSYIEFLLPPIYSAVPGIKVGLPNIIIIFVLYRKGFSAACAVSAVRLALSTLFFGNPVMMIYSMAGAALSLLLMWLLLRTDAFSPVGVSIVGGVSHNLGQIFVAMFMLETAEIGYYMLALAVSGTLAGVFIGIAASLLLKRLNRY